jgi:hypothetical protein
MTDPMNADLAWYIVRHFSDLMSPQERLAYRHLATTIKAGYGDDPAAQERAKGNKVRSRFLSDDPEVLRLASGGLQRFVANTADRILRETPDQVFLNCCPRCAQLARTPKARQCRFCGHDWHNLSPCDPA